MPPKPKPKLQVGSPRRKKRTVLDDSTFDTLAAQAEQASDEFGRDVEKAVPPGKPNPGTRKKPTEVKVANRKGRSGQPYVRKGDGVATVPQYLTLPASLAKRLKIHAIQHDTKVSQVAADALKAYLDSH